MDPPSPSPSPPASPAAAAPTAGKGQQQPQRSWADEVHRKAQWQKQVDYGKNTLGYQTYLKRVPKDKRRRGDPGTPDIEDPDMSKKKFDGQIRAWRRLLHKYDEMAQEDIKAGGSQPQVPERTGSGPATGPLGAGEQAASDAQQTAESPREGSKRVSREKEREGARAVAEGSLRRESRQGRGSEDEKRGSVGEERDKRGRREGERREKENEGRAAGGREGAGSKLAGGQGGRDSAGGERGAREVQREGHQRPPAAQTRAPTYALMAGATRATGTGEAAGEQGHGRRQQQQQPRQQREACDVARPGKDRRHPEGVPRANLGAGVGERSSGDAAAGKAGGLVRQSGPPQESGRSAADAAGPGFGRGWGAPCVAAKKAPESRWESMQEDSRDSWDAIQL